jgi:signal transduction histidine kinase
MYLFWNPLAATLMPFAFHWERSWTQWAASVFISDAAFSGSYGGMLVVLYARRKVYQTLGFIEPQQSRALGVAVSILALPFATYAGFAVVCWWLGQKTPAFFDLTGAFAIGGGFLLVFVGTQSFYELREAKRVAELRVSEAENRTLQAQLKALTAQMNPHLLFNALNTIASLTQTDPNAAEATTVQLAELYRAVLEATKHDTHSLTNELAICRAYLAIEHARFGDRLSYEISVPAELAAQCVPALSLQALVENAVKHGLAPLPKGGSIVIWAATEGRKVKICVEDNGAGLSSAPRPTSTALTNLRARLALIGGSAAQFSLTPRMGGGTSAVMTLPRAPS